MDREQTHGRTAQPLSRRQFVHALAAAAGAGPGAIAAGLGALALTGGQRAEAMEAMVAGLGKLPRRRLGTRLGHMYVTPICISSDWNRELIGPALEIGVNFIHKAGYWRQLPEEVRRLPRESYFTDFTVDSTPNNPNDYDFAYNQITSTLERTGLRYYDIMRAHFGWRSVDAFKHQTGTYRAFQRLKREGKVRYFGVSQHASPYDNPYATYPEMIAAEIESGIIDSMQVWYSHGFPADVRDIFARASAAGIGMTAMKVYAEGHGAMRRDPARMIALKAPGMPGRACIREVMSTQRPDGKPVFQTCVSLLSNMQIFEENVGGVSSRVAQADGFEILA